MADVPVKLPPNVEQFERKLKKREATSSDRNGLQKYRDGKCPPEHHAKVDALLTEYDQLGSTDAMGGLASQAVKVHQPAEARRGSNTKADNATAAHPKFLGAPFHNPYTFIPFGTKPIRRKPTLLTADEVDKDRFTGVLRLTVRTLSPLLTCMPTEQPNGTHPVLAIGDDVVVPASGIRGALRTLMTVLTGGTLGYVDPTLWLTQGRDLNLGPAGKSSPAGTPERVFLARVVTPGSPTRSGTLELNSLSDPLVPLDQIARSIGNPDSQRPKQTKPGEPELRGVVKDGDSYIRLSGTRINQKGVQREGQFKSSGTQIELPAERWAEYMGRHAHADFPELKAGDLVWLEPSKPSLTTLTSAADVKSIQWARWGRKGMALLDAILKHHRMVLPDSLNGDGLVDEVTDLFGQVPDPRNAHTRRDQAGPAQAFAARIRPDNLVFRGAAKSSVERGVQLAPLMRPHPGCIGFYRDNPNLDDVSAIDPLRGYKVYRTTTERGATAPWLYETQGVYGESGKLKPVDQKLSKKCDLLKEGVDGELSLSLRCLSRKELALLLSACSVDWRLGGGKPLGLGHARVTRVELVNEFGEQQLVWDAAAQVPLDRERPSELPQAFSADLDADALARLFHYQATQRPVQKLRYPRAVKENRNTKNRGGHAWFSRHASPRKVTDKHSADQIPRGLQTMHVTGELQTKANHELIRAQSLPYFDPKNPFADTLFAYDYITVNEGFGQYTAAASCVPFDEKTHARASDRSSGHQGQTSDTRTNERNRRD